MIPYTLVVDVWEGSLNIDEAVLEQAGVGGMAIRLNSIEGSHHPDDNFAKQWAEAERFARAPYFVYNPRVSGKVNVEWLGDHLPAGVKRVFVDVEVKRPGYSPEAYATDLATFTSLVKKQWTPTIYTGQWFVPLVAHWPGDVDYWWARYPYAWYPDAGMPITWEEIHAKAKATAWKPGCTLGECVLWQISGDRYKPPGCAGRAVDINLFRGNVDDLYRYFGSGQPKKESWSWQVTKGLRALGVQVDDPPLGAA